jgi:hypothetical protein
MATWPDCLNGQSMDRHRKAVRILNSNRLVTHDNQSPAPGALVISLDLELHWGVRDIFSPESPRAANIAAARKVIPELLSLFDDFGISATWATVGFLLAQNLSELETYKPRARPQYSDTSLDPYRENTGLTEADDPLHFAPGLIETIKNYPTQEIGTHTLSHYYCLAQGQTRETFAADLDCALEIAIKRGIKIQSIVFPRNQHNPGYDDILINRGIISYRGNQKHPAYSIHGWHKAPYKRLFRLLDSYANLSGPYLAPWDRLLTPNGLFNISASLYLRPYTAKLSSWEELRIHRVNQAMEKAAQQRRILHLWWHPCDFGAYSKENLDGLRKILLEFRKCSEEYGMVSLNMAGAARVASSLTIGELQNPRSENTDSGGNDYVHFENTRSD